jgi:hypothetical protein
MRGILTTAAAAAIGLTMLVVPTATAQDLGAQAVGCNPDQHVRIHVQKRGNFIDGLGGFFQCDSPNTVGFRITVQRKRFIGWYDEVPRTGSWPRNQYTTTVFTCTGQGEKTYRTQMTGTLGSGKTWVRNSSQITVTC